MGSARFRPGARAVTECLSQSLDLGIADGHIHTDDGPTHDAGALTVPDGDEPDTDADQAVQDSDVESDYRFSAT